MTHNIPPFNINTVFFASHKKTAVYIAWGDEIKARFESRIIRNPAGLQVQKDQSIDEYVYIFNSFYS